LLGVLALSGCRPDSDTPAQPSTVTDALSRTVTLERPVNRVVTLAPNLTEIVFAAGAGDKLVGVTTADDYPPAVDSLARFSALPIDFEAIAALNPDLVLATDQVNSARDADTFDELGMPLYFFSFTTVDDVLSAIRTTGQLLGSPQSAGAAADSLDAALDALRIRTQSVADRPRVLFLIGDDTLYAFGQNSYVHTLIEIAGGQSITDSMATKAPTLSEEFVLTQKPDVIIGAFGTDYDPDRLLELHPTWDIVPAIQNDRVYSLNPDIVVRPGPRIVEGARRMARMLHPELFADSLHGSTRPPEVR
jgi:ABC-type Fe3+-hydroxamate transport system substrate-binding protein